MNKEIIRNRLVVFLSVLFIILTIFAFSMDNSMMFVICGSITILITIRLIILVIVHFRKEKKKQNEVKELRNKTTKNGFEELYIAVIDNKYHYLFEENIFLKAINLNKIEINFMYKNINNKLLLEPGFIIYQDEKEVIMTLTINEVINEINKKIKRIKENIDDSLNNNSSYFNDELNDRRLDNFRNYTKFLKSNIYVASFVILIFLSFGITFIFDENIRDQEGLVGSIVVLVSFSLIIFIMLLQIINSVKLIKKYKMFLKDKQINTLKETNIVVNKSKLIYLKTKKGTFRIVALKLHSKEGNFIVPVLDSITFKSTKNLKNLYSSLNNQNYNFKYYQKSKIVTSNNKYYEDLIINYLNNDN